MLPWKPFKPWPEALGVDTDYLSSFLVALSAVPTSIARRRAAQNAAGGDPSAQKPFKTEEAGESEAGNLWKLGDCGSGSRSLTTTPPAIS